MAEPERAVAAVPSALLAGLEPIAQLRAHEYVAEQLRSQIGLRIVLPGAALPSERELSALFGVGRATVQAAIRLLEAERLVETRRGRNGGTFVLPDDADDLAKDYLMARLRRERDRIGEALVFRRSVETFAAGLAAAQRLDHELAEIREAGEAVVEAETDATFISQDTRFHLLIARSAHNTFVYEALRHMRLVLNDAISALPETENAQRRAIAEHALIVAAIEGQDPAAVRGRGAPRRDDRT
jgi:DNA-binding FadR family transcriptional regulator